MSNHTILNRFFTQDIFTGLINDKENNLFNTCVQRYIREKDSLKNKTLISEIYKHISENYRNEYFYKNTLLNKLLLGRHSLKTTTALSEIPINKSKADFILINGKAIVYEIKTELDNFERLTNQIDDYYKSFNHVCVVTCESNYQKLSEILKDTPVGISILTKRNTISVRKEPAENNSYLDYETMFKVLRKKEFENILLKHYGRTPLTSQVKYYQECFKSFKEIDVNTAYNYMVEELRKRKIKEETEFNKVPYELKFMVYFSKFKKDDYLKLNGFLNQKWSG